MKKITLVAGLALILVVPAVSVAKPTPDRGDKRAAAKECKTLRGQTDATREAFRTQFRTFGACVKAHAADEAKEEQSAHKNASQECREERGNTADSRAAFNEKYGTNENDKNAFGKCVSTMAHAKNAGQTQQQIMAAIAACKAKGLSGAPLGACVAAKDRVAATKTEAQEKAKKRKKKP
jgi:hypothetical protein